MDAGDTGSGVWVRISRPVAEELFNCLSQSLHDDRQALLAAVHEAKYMRLIGKNGVRKKVRVAGKKKRVLEVGS